MAMNKQPQTVFVPASADEIHKRSNLIAINSKDVDWVVEQTAILLSVEEWERMKKCVELLKRVHKPEYNSNVGIDWEIEKLLKSLNQ